MIICSNKECKSVRFIRQEYGSCSYSCDTIINENEDWEDSDNYEYDDYDCNGDNGTECAECGCSVEYVDANEYEEMMEERYKPKKLSWKE